MSKNVVRISVTDLRGAMAALMVAGVFVAGSVPSREVNIGFVMVRKADERVARQIIRRAGIRTVRRWFFIDRRR